MTPILYRISALDNAGNESAITSAVTSRPKPQKYTVKTDSTGDYLAIQSAIEIAAQVGWPDWVDVDDKKMTGVLKALPERDDILPDINENLVVELYSK